MDYLFLRDKLEYNHETGLLKWKVFVGPGQKEYAGLPTKKKPYGQVMFKRKSYGTHRIAWYLYYGKMPMGMVDHINGDPTDNRICNLREVTARQNQCNRSNHRKGKIAYANWSNKSKKYKSELSFKNKTIYLGLFNCAEDAHNKAIQFLKENRRLM